MSRSSPPPHFPSACVNRTRLSQCVAHQPAPIFPLRSPRSRSRCLAQSELTRNHTLAARAPSAFPSPLASRKCRAHRRGRPSPPLPLARLSAPELTAPLSLPNGSPLHAEQYCLQPRNNARLIPDGTVYSAHFIKTPLYVQSQSFPARPPPPSLPPSVCTLTPALTPPHAHLAHALICSPGLLRRHKDQHPLRRRRR